MKYLKILKYLPLVTKFIELIETKTGSFTVSLGGVNITVTAAPA